MEDFRCVQEAQKAQDEENDTKSKPRRNLTIYGLFTALVMLVAMVLSSLYVLGDWLHRDILYYLGGSFTTFNAMYATVAFVSSFLPLLRLFVSFGITVNTVLQ